MVELRREGSRGRKDEVLEKEEADSVDEAALRCREVEGEYIVQRRVKGGGKENGREKRKEGGVLVVERRKGKEGKQSELTLLPRKGNTEARALHSFAPNHTDTSARHHTQELTFIQGSVHLRLCLFFNDPAPSQSRLQL